MGLYAEDYPVIGDYVFHLRLLQAGEVGFIDHALANWHHRPLQPAEGTAGNSMYTNSSDHTEYDLSLIHIFAIAGLAGVVFSLPVLFYVAVAFALVAAGLNALFGFCLGCEMYLLGKRLFGSSRPSTGNATQTG